MEKQVKRIPWRNGVEIIIYTCPYCGHRCWEYIVASEDPKDVPCPLCGHTII